MTFQAGEYENRKDLERAILSLVGPDITDNRKANHSIEGSEEDLKKLFLDDTCTVFGVKCLLTGDKPTYERVKIKKNK